MWGGRGHRPALPARPAPAGLRRRRARPAAGRGTPRRRGHLRAERRSPPRRPLCARRREQRSTVLPLLDDQDGLRTAQDLHALLPGRGDAVGLATVHRALQALGDDGLVDVLRTEGEAAYRRCSPVHHDLVCRSCGRTVDVADPPVERWAARVAAEHGFADVQHQLEVFGTCPACAAH